MKPSQLVIDRIHEDLLIKKLAIDKNIISKEWSKSLYWESYESTGRPHPIRKTKYKQNEYFTMLYFSIRDYWGETDEYSIVECLCVELNDGKWIDDEEYPPILTRAELIEKLKSMKPLKEPLYKEQPK